MGAWCVLCINVIMIDLTGTYVPLFFLLRAQKDHVDLIVDCLWHGLAFNLYGCASMYMHGTW